MSFPTSPLTPKVKLSVHVTDDYEVGHGQSGGVRSRRDGDRLTFSCTWGIV